MEEMKLTGINPDILRWARETAGLDLEIAARKIDLRDTKKRSAPDRLRAMESGEEAPTRSHLSKMAKAYWRNSLVFYCSRIPREVKFGEDFRKLPQTVSKADRGLVNAMLRRTRVMQSMIKDCLEEESETEHLDYVGSLKGCREPEHLATSIRTIFGIDREIYRRKRTTRDAFAYLRDQVEDRETLVNLVDNLGNHHSTIPVEAFLRAVLADEIVPVIVINANDSPAAWSFTLLHELVHLLTGRTSISGPVHQSDMRIERLCDDVAGRVLVDESEIATIRIDRTSTCTKIVDRISEMASRLNVSRSLIAYRLNRARALNDDVHRSLLKTFRADFDNRKNSIKQTLRSEGEQPNPVAIRRHLIGKATISLIRRLVMERSLSASKAGIALGVPAASIFELIR